MFSLFAFNSFSFSVGRGWGCLSSLSCVMMIWVYKLGVPYKWGDGVEHADGFWVFCSYCTVYF